VSGQDWAWPALPPTFNWALDYLDPLAATDAVRTRPALWVTDGARLMEALTYEALVGQAARVAHYWRACGVRAGDRLMLMLPNSADALVATVAAIKAGVVLVPCSAVR
jgi:acetyl-CoA synthetase